MPEHICHAEDCTAPVPPRMFACRQHWGMVEPALQRALWAVYREGQEQTKQVTRAYLIVQTVCRIQIAAKEYNEAGLDRATADLVRLTADVDRWRGLDPAARAFAAVDWVSGGAAAEARVRKMAASP